MKRFLALTIVMSLALGLTANALAKKPVKRITRVASVAYDASMQLGLATPVITGNLILQKIEIPSKAGETYVSVTATDQTGGDVFFTLSQSSEGPQAGEAVCTSTNEPMRIDPGTPVYIWIHQGLCENGSPAIAVKGTFEATFSNRP